MKPFTQSKYVLSVSPKKEEHYNSIYNICNGCEAGLIDVEVGKRGWIFYKHDNDHTLPWHQLLLTTIEFIGVDELGSIHIHTQNSLYVLKKKNPS